MSEQITVTRWAEPPGRPLMFFVYYFDQNVEDFDVAGGFTREEEAVAFARSFDASCKHIIEQPFGAAMAHATTVRLASLAEPLKRIAAMAPPENQGQLAMLGLHDALIVHADGTQAPMAPFEVHDERGETVFEAVTALLPPGSKLMKPGLPPTVVLARGPAE